MNDYTRNNSTSSDTPQLAAAKFILLGLWGIFSSLMFERRARRHRRRIDTIRKELEPGFTPDPKTGLTIWIWVLFHTGIVSLGVAILIVRL